jgi:hypothetical protein
LEEEGKEEEEAETIAEFEFLTDVVMRCSVM